MLNLPIAPLIVPKLQSGKFEVPHVVTSVQMQVEPREQMEAEEFSAQTAAR
jgi:hypothetical protein